jgi:TRAP-type C4-dicarboxylate transport system substrate-binding protein
MAKSVHDATNGQVKIKVYEANQLVKIFGVPQAVQSGAIEMGCSAGPYLARIIPEGNIEFGLPFSWRTWDEVWEVWTQYGFREKLREAYAEKGLFLLTIQPAAEYAVMSTKPVYKVEDFNGLKVRTTGLTAKLLQKLGASPALVPGAEQYVALQRGTVDATVYPVFVLDAYKINEVIRYVILPSIISPPTTNIFINMNEWNSLGPDLQKAVLEASDDHQVPMNERYLREGYVAVGRLLMRGIGEAIVLPEAEVKKLRQTAFEVRDEAAAKSPRCKELVNIVKQFMKDKGISAK